MAFLSNFDIAVSGLSAERLRLDIIGQNIANAKTTRTKSGDTYVRQVAVFSERKTYENFDTKHMNFGDALKHSVLERQEKRFAGVEVSEIVKDETPSVPVYDPSHPDADADGYYYLPNVDITEEQIDAMAASQSYDANMTIFKVMKRITQKALTIGT